MQSACVARQPILDTSGNLFAYELLFRSCATGDASHTDAVVATAQVLENVLGNIGVQSLVGPHKAFVNCNREMLLGGMLESLDPTRFVLEILETVRLDAEVASALHQLKQVGFELALDDFVCTPQNLHHCQPIIPLLTYIKMDLIGNTQAQLKEAVQLFSTKGIVMLAEKVETWHEYQMCLRNGFELFQGFYFAHPEMIASPKLDSRIHGILNILQALQRNPEIPSLEVAFKSAPEITVNFLRYINSAAISTRHPVNSIRQAIALVGIRNLNKWLLLMLYARSDQGQGGQNSPLLENASQRAYFMEGVAKAIDPKGTLAGQAFLVGLLSRMDALCMNRMDVILAEFALGQDIADALLKGEGVLGKLLKLSEALEDEANPPLQEQLQEIGLSRPQFQEQLVQAYASASTSR